MVQYTQQQRSVIVTSSNVARVSQDYAQSDLVADFETQRLRDLTQSLTAVIRSILLTLSQYYPAHHKHQSHYTILSSSINI